MAAMTPLIITEQSVLAPLRAKICDNGAGQTMLPDIIIVNIQTDLNTYGTDGAFPTGSKAPYMEAQMVVLRNSLKSSPRKTNFVLLNSYKSHPTYPIVCKVLGLHLQF